MSDEVSEAIEESTIAVVVVPENYVSSVWCLDVLAKITEGLGSPVNPIPVLYDVDPEDLRRRSGKFADDFRRHGEREDPETVTRWRDSLTKLSYLVPLCSRICDDDSKLLDDLLLRLPIRRLMGSPQWYKTFEGISSVPPLPVDLQLCRGMREDLFREYITQDAASVTKNMLSASKDHNLLLGMDRHKKAVYGLLDLDSRNQVRTIGICGAEGAGKTTLAECVFEDISRHFQHHCFFNSHQNRISPSLRDHLTRTRSSRDSFDDIKPSLVNRNILLVVDDSEQFKDIVKVSHWLSPGSRVIMTSKDKSSLVSCGVKHVYEMGFLRYDEALPIFSEFAFKQDYPRVGFEQLTVRAVHLAGHLPLALKLLGSFLCGNDEETWRSTLQRLDASQGNCIREVCSYVAASEYLPIHQIKSKRYTVVDEGEYSPSYHMLL